MSEQENILSKKALTIIGIISIIIFVAGISLFALGYNEAFYIENTIVQAIFQVITSTSEPLVLIVVIAVFYFIYDKKFAKNLALSLIFAISLNAFLKSIFQDPRPPTNVDPNAEYGYIETSYGFPSSTTQAAIATWGYIAYEFKDKPKPYVVPVILSIFIFLVAISRIIIGVHDLQDIIGGLLIGIGLLIAFIYLEPIIAEKFNTLNLIIKILIASALSVSLFLIGVLLFPTSGLELVENPPIYSDSGAFGQVMGALLGLSVGYLLENKYVNYQPSEVDKKWKIINLILGLIITLVLYIVLSFLIHGNVFLRFIRYAVLSFVVFLFVPWIFTKINRK